MKESKGMMRRELSFMKDKGAPKSMIRHEEKEAGMKKGVKKFARGRLIGTVPSVSRGTAANQYIPVPRLPPPAGSKGVPYVNALTISGNPNLQFVDPRDGKPYYKFVDPKTGMEVGKDIFGRDLFDDDTSPGRKVAPADQLEVEPDDGMAAGGRVKKMARGGMTKSGGSYRRAADGVASKGKTKGHVVKMASGGIASSYRRAADGIATKGKTKGKMVKMMKGGYCG